MAFYGDSMRALQDRWEGRAVPDRLEQVRMHREFTEADRRMIAEAPFFFLATHGADSVDCSFKGGDPGFVRVTGPNRLEWPDYDGNRMHRSLGNIAETGRAGLLFIRLDGACFDGSAARLRLNGRAEIDDSPEAVAGLPGAKRLVRFEAEHIFPNCPRYIPTMSAEGASDYVPRPGHVPPEPPWKSSDWARDLFEAERDAES